MTPKFKGVIIMTVEKFLNKEIELTGRYDYFVAVVDFVTENGDKIAKAGRRRSSFAHPVAWANYAHGKTVGIFRIMGTRNVCVAVCDKYVPLQK